MPSPPTPYERRPNGAVILGLLIIALIALHAFTLDWEDYWYDELFTWNVAELPSFGAVWERLKSDTSPPVYFWLLHSWQPLARQFDLSYRWLSVAGSMLGILGFYLWMRRGFGARHAHLAGVLIIFSPFWIHFAQELRMYSLYPALLWWGAFFLTRALQTRRQVDWGAAAVCNALAMWTHYHAAFFILAEVVALFFIHKRQGESFRIHIRRGLLLLFALTSLLSAPLLVLIPHQFSSSLSNISWLQIPKLRHFIGNFVIDYTFYSTSAQPVWGHAERMLALSFYTLLAAGIMLAFRRRLVAAQRHTRAQYASEAPRISGSDQSNALIFLVSVAFIPPILMIIISFLPVKFYTPGRYAILSLAPYLGCLALLIQRVIDIKFLKGLLITLLLGLNVISVWQILGHRHKPEWSALAAAVDEHVGDDDILFGFPDFWFNGFGLYLGRNVEMQDIRDFALTSSADQSTSHVYALVFNLAAAEDTWHPWNVLRFMEMNSASRRRVYWDPWHTLLRLDELDLAKMRRWYLLRGQAGREEILAWNPPLFIGAEDLADWLPPDQFYAPNLNPKGELASWLVYPPIIFQTPLTLEPGTYTIIMKAGFRFGAEPPPAKLTLRLDDIPVQTFLIEEEGAVRLTARHTINTTLTNPRIEWDGTTFRPRDINPESDDDRRLLMEMYWMALIKDMKEPSPPLEPEVAVDQVNASQN